MRKKALVSVLLLLAVVAVYWVAQAGDLEPPGPPAPTMRTLDLVEPRIPIGPDTTPGDADSTFNIIQPGSYYLTGNLTGEVGKHGIKISNSRVTLDLGGFELNGAGGSVGDGVHVQGPESLVTIFNGTLINWAGYGLYAGEALGAQLRDIRATVNSGPYGISAGSSGIVSHCVAYDNMLGGILANTGTIVTNSTARQNGAAGILGGAIVVRECTSYVNAGVGIHVTGGGMIVDCDLVANLNGIEVGGGAAAMNNTCGEHLNGAGITVVAGPGNSRVEGNYVYENKEGIRVNGGTNSVMRNTANDNDCNYVISGVNMVGPITTDPATASAFANFDLQDGGCL